MATLYFVLAFSLSILLAPLLTKKKKNKFLEDEAERFIFKSSRVDKNWNSQGRVYANGIAFIIKNDKKKIINQSKLADTGILY